MFGCVLAYNYKSKSYKTYSQVESLLDDVQAPTQALVLLPLEASFNNIRFLASRIDATDQDLEWLIDDEPFFATEA